MSFLYAAGSNGCEWGFGESRDGSYHVYILVRLDFQGSLANAVMTYLRDTNPRVSLRGTTPSLLLLAGDRRAKDPVEAIIALCESAAAERVGGVGRYRQVVQ
jgi:hypothetical protein